MHQGVPEHQPRRDLDGRGVSDPVEQCPAEQRRGEERGPSREVPAQEPQRHGAGSDGAGGNPLGHDPLDHDVLLRGPHASACGRPSIPANVPATVAFRVAARLGHGNESPGEA